MPQNDGKVSCRTSLNEPVDVDMGVGTAGGAPELVRGEGEKRLERAQVADDHHVLLEVEHVLEQRYVVPVA